MTIDEILALETMILGSDDDFSLAQSLAEGYISRGDALDTQCAIARALINNMDRSKDAKIAALYKSLLEA